MQQLGSCIDLEKNKLPEYKSQHINLIFAVYVLKNVVPFIIILTQANPNWQELPAK